MNFEEPSELSRYGRYVAIADIVSALELTELVGLETRVYTIIDFEAIDGAEIFVGARCRDLGGDVNALEGDVSPTQIDDGQSVRIQNYRLEFTELWDDELQRITETAYAAWHADVVEECLLRSQLSFRSLTVRSDDDFAFMAHDMLSAIAQRDAQYGVPFVSYSITDDVLVGALSDHCDKSQEAIDFLARHWIERHANELSAQGIADIQIVTTTEGLDLETLAQSHSWAASDTED